MNYRHAFPWVRGAMALLVLGVCVPLGAAPPLFVQGPHGHGVANDVWVSASYVHSWIRGASVPPLLAANPSGTATDQIGVPGVGGTQILLGGSTEVNGDRPGWRLRGGMWVDECRSRAIEFDFLQLGSESDIRQVAGDNTSIYSRPYIDAISQRPLAELISVPGGSNGVARADVASDGLNSLGLSFSQCLACCHTCCRQERLDFVIGYRHLETNDAVAIEERVSSPLFAAGTVLSLRDDFKTTNQFDGCEVGLRYQLRQHRWQLNATAQVAIGATHGDIRIDGQTSVTSMSSPPTMSPGGFYALSSNMGRHEFSDFAAIYQAELEVSYWLTDRCSLNLGYLFLLWPEVYRAGEQIDPVINPNLLPPPITPLVGPLRPEVPFEDSTWWAHGLQLGMTVTF